MISRRNDWVLGSEALEKLLGTLDPDRERAAEKYETIRRRLVQVFQWRGCSESEALADETIDRVSRKLVEGEEIRASDPTVYFYGVARNVLKEFWTERRREQALQSASAVRERPEGSEDLAQREMEERLDCLDRCLARLSKESRGLITVYYRSAKSGKIADRSDLTRTLGVSHGALRIRAHRIRRQLEQCVNDCMRNRSDG